MSDPVNEAVARALAYGAELVKSGQSVDFAPRNILPWAAREALAPVRELHKPVPVYGDDCEHEIDLDPYGGCKFEHPDGKHHYVEEIGWTCDHSYDICKECCTDDGYQSEECATHHNHGFGPGLICATARLIYSEEELS